MAKFISIIKEYLNDKRNKKVMKILLSVVITSIIFLKLKNELYTIDYAQILITLRSIPRIQVLILFLLGLLSVSLIMGYDLVLFHFFKPNITYSKLLRFSWIANAMNNFIGFGGVVAFSFRNIMYKSFTSLFGSQDT
jgi:phosphatidylglycerol lysyltransferase